MVTRSTPTLTTERLSLVALRPEDADELAPALDQPALHEFIGGAPLSPAELRRRFERLAVGHSSDGREMWHNWAVRRRTSGDAVGTMQATVTPASRVAQIAWVVGVPWQGRGYATEAAAALVAWLVSSGVETIEAYVHPGNAASARVAERSGLQPTDELVDGERVWRRVTEHRPVRGAVAGSSGEA